MNLLEVVLWVAATFAWWWVFASLPVGGSGGNPVDCHEYRAADRGLSAKASRHRS